jgi:flavin-dependent dehydrogenase
MAALRRTGHVARWLERGKAALADSRTPATALAPSAILSRVVGDRWLAVGDAASACDPVAAQGIVKALCDGEAAADAIAAWFAGAGDAPLLAYQDGVFARFRDYVRLRRHLYGRERRWPQAPFWQNRLALCGSGVDA